MNAKHLYLGNLGSICENYLLSYLFIHKFYKLHHIKIQLSFEDYSEAKVKWILWHTWHRLLCPYIKNQEDDLEEKSWMNNYIKQNVTYKKGFL